MTRTERPETPDPRSDRARRTRRAVLGGTATLLLVIAASFTADGQWSTAAGIVTGGGLVLALMILAGRRARGRGVEADTASRVFGYHADERDTRVYVAALATVGIAGLAVTAVGLVVVGLGVDPVAVLRAMPYVLFGTGAVAFVVIDRRT